MSSADGDRDIDRNTDAGVQRDLDRFVAGASSAHQRLLGGLDLLGRDTIVGSSVATRLLGALIEQADQQLLLFDGADSAMDPLVALMAATVDTRDDIAEDTGSIAGSPIDGVSIIAVRRSIWALEMAWSSTMHWDRARVEAVFMRWRTVELAHLELSDHLDGLSPGLDALPGDYVREELRRLEMLWRARRPMGMTTLPPAVLALEPAERLGWFLGRVNLDGVDPAGIDPAGIDSASVDRDP